MCNNQVRAKDVVSHGAAGCMSSMFSPVLQGGSCEHWVCHTAKEPEFRNPQSFSLGWEQTCTIFALERDIIFILLNSKKKPVFCSGGRHNLDLLSLFLQNILTKLIDNKLCWASAQKRFRTLSPDTLLSHLGSLVLLVSCVSPRDSICNCKQI